MLKPFYGWHNAIRWQFLSCGGDCGIHRSVNTNYFSMLVILMRGLLLYKSGYIDALLAVNCLYDVHNKNIDVVAGIWDAFQPSSVLFSKKSYDKEDAEYNHY